MMKRILCFGMALVLALGLAACGSRPVQEAEEAVESLMPTDDLTNETMTPAVETPEMSGAPEARKLTTTDVLDSSRDAEPDELGTPVMTYAAAARVLAFCEDGGADRADFQQEVRSYFEKLDGEQRERFRKSAQAVTELAQRIAQGDVEQSELEQNLADTDTDWRDFDPVNFQHENLKKFVDALTAELER